MKIILPFCRYLLFLVLLLASGANYATPTVNILSWWTYLDNPWEKELIYKNCHAYISYDQYYSNTEFNQRWKESKYIYDIVIFEDTMYPAIENQISKIPSKLYLHAKYYNPTIKKKYYSQNYPHNIAYFYQSVTGFLWNPSLINLKKEDSLNDIFQKAMNNLVVILDDPIVFQKLKNISDKNKHYLTVDEFRRISKNAQVFITNDYDQIYTKPNFAFSYIWSGDAILDMISSHRKLNFLMTPSVSYISSDMLAQLNNKPEVACVANYLTSAEFLNRLQNDTYYFSPYADDSKVKNPTFKKIYANYIKNLSWLPWIEPISPSKLIKLTKTWKTIKLSIEP